MILRISLLVATLDRCEELNRLLSSLQKQSYCHFHVYIADQNPSAFLDAVLRPYSKCMPISVVPMLPCGVSLARNALLEHAKGDIIAFPDDDCWYEPDTLAAAVNFFRENPSCAALLGNWVESAKHYPPAASTAPLTRYSAFASSETYVQFYRQEVIQAVGNFDTTLGPGTGLPWGCGEDTDYVLRAVARNFCVRRAPSVRVHHPLPALYSPLGSHLRQKYTNYALGRMHLLKKHAFPLWFKLLNVLYPLALLPLETVMQGRAAAQYRWTMFKGRLRGLFL